MTRPILEELSIRGLGVIDEVTLRLAAGLTVLTGETGAGKTMVVSGLELWLGGRADADRVRAGARASVVEGRVRPVPEAAVDWTDPTDDDLVISREVAVDDAGARSRARIGGRLAPVSALAEVAGPLVEIHSQHQNVRLSESSAQRALLDRFGGEPIATALERYRRAYSAWREATAELDALREGGRDRARQIDRLRFELAEIDATDPQPGEEEQLDTELARLEHAERLRDAAAASAQAVTADGGARDTFGAVVAALRSTAGIDPQLDELAKRAEGLAAEVQDLALELGSYADGIDLDPARLEALRQRRGALQGLVRKYAADAAGIAAYAQEARAQLERLEGGGDRVQELEAEVGELEAEVDAAGGTLRAARQEAGERLATDVGHHLADLAMREASFAVELHRTDPGPEGADQVGFVLAANPGEPLLPLAKAASGGERSRVALAVRLALTEVDDTPVMIFDEVDAGIGGAVAVEVGRKLATLAAGRQVLCVTHLAQLAAFADAHLAVEKISREDGRAAARVRALDEQERLTELSRMLSGSPDSPAASEHAAELRAAATALMSEG